MSDRPIGAVLAALAAMFFVAAFAAAAVLHNDSAPLATERPAPATAQEDAALATHAAPTLSRVAALPALHLPKAKPKKKRAAPRPKVTVSAAPPTSTATPAPTATPVATAAPPVQRPAAPPATPRPRRPSTPNVGDTFDTSG